jgi:hypothetical protein
MVLLEEKGGAGGNCPNKSLKNPLHDVMQGTIAVLVLVKGLPSIALPKAINPYPLPTIH